MHVSRNLRIGLVLASPIIVYLAIFLVYPLVTLFQNAFTNASGAFSLSNFETMPSDSLLKISLENTGYYFFGSVAFEYGIGFGVAFLLYNYTGRLRSAFRTIIFLPLMVSPVVIGLMWLFLFNTDYGPIDYLLHLVGLPTIDWLGSTNLAMPTLILANTWEYSPFVFLIIYAGLQMVPQSYYEAASVDGLARGQTFRYITLPAIRSSMIIAFLLNAIGVLKGFDLVYVLTSGGPAYSTYILSYYVYSVGFVFFETHYAAALAILFLLIVGTFVLLMLRFTSVEEYLGLRRTTR